MLNFNFLEKGLGTVSLPHFMYDFSRKVFLVLYSIIWPNFNAWLPLLLEILVNMCMVSVYQPGCDVIDFEIYLIFLTKPLSYMTKKSRQKFKYLENEKSFWGEIKSIFHLFQRTFRCQKLSQTLECAFNFYFLKKIWSSISFYEYVHIVTRKRLRKVNKPILIRPVSVVKFALNQITLNHKTL